jgi:hypothetical protein
MMRPVCLWSGRWQNMGTLPIRGHVTLAGGLRGLTQGMGITIMVDSYISGT